MAEKISGQSEICQHDFQMIGDLFFKCSQCKKEVFGACPDEKQHQAKTLAGGRQQCSVCHQFIS